MRPPVRIFCSISASLVLPTVEARAVVEDEVEGFDVVGDFAAEQAVDAATVVAHHAAEGCSGSARGGVGGVGQVVQLGGFAEAV